MCPDCGTIVALACEICGKDATVIVTVPTGTGLIAGPMCDQHADDIAVYVDRVEPIEL
jgi:hypothetical protein